MTQWDSTWIGKVFIYYLKCRDCFYKVSEGEETGFVEGQQL